MKEYTVYIHRNKINGKNYVGITYQELNQRWRSGKGYKKQIKFARAIKKYGWDGFDHIIVAEKLTEAEASQLEIDLIEKLDAIQNGYNISPGGSTTNHSPETLEKMRQSMLGKKHTEETKRKISKSKDNIKIPVYCIETDKHYESVAEASRLTGIDPANIHRVCKGKQITTNQQHWVYEGQDAPKREDKRLRPVVCIDTGKEYVSINEASRDTGIDFSNIKKVCDGKYRHAGGFKWAYQGEEYKPKPETLKKQVICVETQEVFESAAAAGKKYHLDRSSIGKACRGVLKTCGGLHWEFYQGE